MPVDAGGEPRDRAVHARATGRESGARAGREEAGERGERFESVGVRIGVGVGVGVGGARAAGRLVPADRA